MKSNMKLVGIIICLMTFTSLTVAQELPEFQEKQPQEKRLPREVPNPEKIATQMTNQMQRSLQLTEKQYKKIYKLNLKEQRVRFEKIQNANNQRPPIGEGFGMREGHMPMSMGGGDEPPMMREGRSPEGMGERSPMRIDNDSAESMKKAAETKEKKIKKILTSEQYEKWKIEQEANRMKAVQIKKPLNPRPQRNKSPENI